MTIKINLTKYKIPGLNHTRRSLFTRPELACAEHSRSKGINQIKQRMFIHQSKNEKLTHAADHFKQKETLVF